MIEYYVYIYYDPTKNNEPFYIGIGKLGSKKGYDRSTDHLREAKRLDHPKDGNKHKFYRIKSILNLGLEPKIEKVFITKELKEVKLKEIELITNIGRRDLEKGPLTNLTNGGDGCINFSEETKNKISNSLKGKHYINSGQFKQNVVPWNKNKTISEEQKIQISNTLKRKYQSGEIKRSKSNLGRHKLEESKLKLKKTLRKKRETGWSTWKNRKDRTPWNKGLKRTIKNGEKIWE